jgi:hypothetical protein
VTVRIALIACIAAIVVAAAAVATTTTARAATCSDYTNQAAAQRGHDTRDADGDGIYCERLPCPCLPPDPRAGGAGDDQPADEEQTESGGARATTSCTRRRSAVESAQNALNTPPQKISSTCSASM